jgi:hypothetical protein
MRWRSILFFDVEGGALSKVQPLALNCDGKTPELICGWGYKVHFFM